jgi:hypothetical protein
MHPHGEILLKAMVAACATFFIVKIAAALPAMMAALAAN